MIQMRLLFNGDILSNYNSKNFGRSGIYFVAYALLKEFCGMEDLTVTVYCSREKKRLLEGFKESTGLEFDIKTLKPMLHRMINTRFKELNEKRELKGLKPVRGGWRLEELSLSLDRIFYKSDAKAFGKYDAYISPCEPAPYAIERSGIPVYTVIHDLIPIVTGEFGISKGYWLYDVLHQVTTDKYYFCISECTKKDFLEYCPKADPSHVRVVYNGYAPRDVDPDKQAPDYVIREKGLTEKQYILILGTVVPHKNVERQIVSGLRFIKENGLEDFRIAIVGSCGNSEELLKKANISDDDRKYIVICGYVPDEHIRAYYRGAFCLSFTSLYEGFGLPVLEAMTEECPVVTSNTSSLPEVAGDAAVCISPEDMDAHVEAYKRLLVDRDFRAELIERGKKQANKFKWNDTAKQMVEVIKHDRTV